MSWREFTDLLAGLPGESQLARMIAVRTAEGEELKLLSPGALKLRAEWSAWLDGRMTDGEKQSGAKRLQKTFKSLFYEGGKTK